MDFNNAIAAFLLSLSTFLGVETVPDTSDLWSTNGQWIKSGENLVFSARNDDSNPVCESTRGYIQLPLVIHGTHELYLEDKLVASYGSRVFAESYTFYNQPIVSCNKLVGGSITWKAYAYSEYFARFAHYPTYIAINDEAIMGAELRYIASGASLVILGIFAFFVFYSVFPKSVMYFIGGVTGWATFFITMAWGGSLFGLSMIAAHKLADAALWFGTTCLLSCFYFEKWLTATLLKTYLVFVGLGLVFIIFGSNGDTVQFGTNLGFPLTLISIAYVTFTLLKKIIFEGKTTELLFPLFAISSFAYAILHDIALTAGVIDGFMYMPVGIFAAFFALSLLMGNRVRQLYFDNILLNQRLEQKISNQQLVLVEAEQHAEQMQAARLSWLEFMASFLRHELKNSIAGVLTSLQLEKKRNASSKYIERAEKSCEKMKTVLETVWDATSIESMVASAKLNRVNLSLIVKNRIDDLSLIYSSQEFSCDISPQIEIFGNEEVLELMIDKLANNAVEHSEDGAIIEIQLKKLGRDKATLAISNNGDQLPKQKDKLFEFSYSTKAKPSEHFGIGLYLVKLITDLHSADVNAINMTNGAKFVVTFDLISNKSE